MAFLLGAIIGVIILAFGGAIGFYLYIQSHGKKLVWKAYVYQLSDSYRKKLIDPKTNKLLRDIPLQEMKPLCIDIIEKDDRTAGIITYRMLKLQKICNEVTEDCVDRFGEESFVNVLLIGDTGSVLRKGYNARGGVIFEPMPYDRMNMLTSNIIDKKARMKDKKSILEAISPWVVTGILVFGLFLITYFLSNSFIKSSDINAEAVKYAADKSVENAKLYNEALSQFGYIQENIPLEKKSNVNITKAPSIE